MSWGLFSTFFPSPLGVRSIYGATMFKCKNGLLAFILPFLIGLPLLCTGCNASSEASIPENKAEKSAPTPESFLALGEFSVEYLDDGYVKVRDGAKREFLLVPRGQPPLEGFPPSRIVETPVRSVAAYGNFDISILKALGVIEDVLVGVTAPKEDWVIPEVVRGMESGKIAYLGTYNSMDFEVLKKTSPEMVMTWDHSVIPILEDLGVPCLITSTPVAMCMNAKMKFVNFLAPFFGRETEASEYFGQVAGVLEDIAQMAATADKHPKVMWGDIYEKRVLVEPGNAWVGELVGLAMGDYVFDDVFGASCIEISMERFLTGGEDADILFTYRTPKTGATSKEALAKTNPAMSAIHPLHAGKVFAPLPHYSQSGDKLDEILLEIAALVHPDLYPDFEPKYFAELPEKEI